MNKRVIRLRTPGGAELPAALAEMLLHLPEQGGSFALVCSGFTCQPPTGSVEEMRAGLEAVR